MAASFVLNDRQSSTGEDSIWSHRNGQVIITSEPYEIKASAIDGIGSVKPNAHSEIDDQTDQEPYVSLDASIALLCGQPIRSVHAESVLRRNHGDHRSRAVIHNA